jgi:hypothetical protein
VYKCRDNRYSIKPPLHFLCFESANKSQINGAWKIVDIVFEGKKISVNFALQTVVVAQLVRALDCGSRGREFEPRLPPKKISLRCEIFLFISAYIIMANRMLIFDFLCNIPPVLSLFLIKHDKSVKKYDQ